MMETRRFNYTDISEGNLVLINPLHPLRHDIQKDKLESVAQGICLEKQAAKMLNEAMTFLRGSGQIVPISGYRTLKEQTVIYSDSLCENGESFTRKYVAIPGCSEHQSGLAVDLAENKEAIDFICPEFPETGICGQFKEVAANYGFIERYPAGCEQITHIGHEPWHFRYVGYPHSSIMKKKGRTLEEYTEYLKQFPFDGRHLHFRHQQREVEVFFVPIGPDRETIVNIPDGVPYQFSGNNVDGVVVTLWRGRL